MKVEESTENVPNPMHEAAKRGNLDFVKECLSNKVSSFYEHIWVNLWSIIWELNKKTRYLVTVWIKQEILVNELIIFLKLK